MTDASKDPGIKLFGMTIQMPDFPAPATEMDVFPGGTASSPAIDSPGDDCSAEDRSCLATASAEESSSLSDDEELQKNQDGEESDISKEDEGTLSLEGEQSMDETVNDDLKEPSADKDCATTEIEEEGKESDRTLKKPEKIIPCPQCKSMETKFCYFNNYNVSQPRHFCRNCQRYWTSGGTMRNMAVGAGRRKNKNLGPHHHLTVVETFKNVSVDLPDGIQHHSVNSNGNVFTLACDSLKKTAGNCAQNGIYEPEKTEIPASYGAENSCGSSVNAASAKNDIGQNGFPDMMRQNNNCFPGCPPWPYFSAIPPPGHIFPGFPMPFYPAAAYWGCTVPCAWANPNLGPQNHTSSVPNSPTLGKHSRDEKDVLEQTNNKKREPLMVSNPEKCLWVPKTLRFDNPEDAAKSSIWAALGIKNNRVDSICGGAFKAFKLKDGEKPHVSRNCSVLEANPAAFSRSMNFHESS